MKSIQAIPSSLRQLLAEWHATVEFVRPSDSVLALLRKEGHIDLARILSEGTIPETVPDDLFGAVGGAEVWLDDKSFVWILPLSLWMASRRSEGGGPLIRRLEEIADSWSTDAANSPPLALKDATRSYLNDMCMSVIDQSWPFPQQAGRRIRHKSKLKEILQQP